MGSYYNAVEFKAGGREALAEEHQRYKEASDCKDYDDEEVSKLLSRLRGYARMFKQAGALAHVLDAAQKAKKLQVHGFTWYQDGCGWEDREVDVAIVNEKHLLSMVYEKDGS